MIPGTTMDTGEPSRVSSMSDWLQWDRERGVARLDGAGDLGCLIGEKGNSLTPVLEEEEGIVAGNEVDP